MPFAHGCLSIWRERTGQLAICGLNLMLLLRFVDDLQRTGRWTGVLAAMGLSLVVYFTVMRRPAIRIDDSFAARAMALTATTAPLAFQPLNRSAIPDAITGWVAIFGTMITVAGLLSLGRSFAVMPSHRGRIAREGVYRLVRHPLYAGYFWIHIAFVVAYPAWWNFGVWLIAEGSQLLRLQREERVLAADPEYVAYRTHVRWRLLPGIY